MSIYWSEWPQNSKLFVHKILKSFSGYRWRNTKVLSLPCKGPGLLCSVGLFLPQIMAVWHHHLGLDIHWREIQCRRILLMGNLMWLHQQAVSLSLCDRFPLHQAALLHPLDSMMTQSLNINRSTDGVPWIHTQIHTAVLIQHTLSFPVDSQSS